MAMSIMLLFITFPICKPFYDDPKYYGVQTLLMILDSALNKAGMLLAVYVKTDKGILIEIKPHVRIPRTFKRFAGIMCKFLNFHLNRYHYAA